MKREREAADDEPRAPRRYDEDANDYKRARSSYDQVRDRRPSYGHNNDRNGGGGGNGRDRQQPREDGSGNNDGRKAAVEVRTLKTERESDPHRLAQRQKQIDYGKNTLGYDRYCTEVPRHQRRKGEHPMTPHKTLKVSKKHFDSMVRRWRQGLHKYDPPELVERLQAAEQQVKQENAAAASSAADDDADLDPELADLDPSKQAAGSTAPSIFDMFHDDESAAVDYDDDDDDDLL